MSVFLSFFHTHPLAHTHSKALLTACENDYCFYFLIERKWTSESFCYFIRVWNRCRRSRAQPLLHIMQINRCAFRIRVSVSHKQCVNHTITVPSQIASSSSWLALAAIGALYFDSRRLRSGHHLRSPKNWWLGIEAQFYFWELWLLIAVNFTRKSLENNETNSFDPGNTIKSIGGNW